MTMIEWIIYNEVVFSDKIHISPQKYKKNSCRRRSSGEIG
jgi:hypothetical protein